jgi:hypothetical protein
VLKVARPNKIIEYLLDFVDLTGSTSVEQIEWVVLIASWVLLERCIREVETFLKDLQERGLSH